MDTLTTALIVIMIVVSVIALITALLSFMGLDPETCHLGDSGVGLLMLLLPGITLGTGVAGMMHMLDVAGPVASLATGAGALVLGCATLYPLLRVLVRGSRPDLTIEKEEHRADQ